MTLDPTLTNAGPSLSALRRIDACSARFEKAWNAGQNPNIEDFLDGVEEPERTLLFRELFLSELELRKERNSLLDEANYQRRFPQYCSIIYTVFLEIGQKRHQTDVGSCQRQ